MQLRRSMAKLLFLITLKIVRKIISQNRCIIRLCRINNNFLSFTSLSTVFITLQTLLPTPSPMSTFFRLASDCRFGSFFFVVRQVVCFVKSVSDAVHYHRICQQNRANICFWERGFLNLKLFLNPFLVCNTSTKFIYRIYTVQFCIPYIVECQKRN